MIISISMVIVVRPCHGASPRHCDERRLRFVGRLFRRTLLAHSRSALKRWRQSLVARDRNRSVKSRTRTLLTRALNALDDGADAAEDAVKAAVSALDRA